MIVRAMLFSARCTDAFNLPSVVHATRPDSADGQDCTATRLVPPMEDCSRALVRYAIAYGSPRRSSVGAVPTHVTTLSLWDC